MKQNLFKFLRTNRESLTTLGVFLAISAVSSIIFYFRYTYALRHANFFAEDGIKFTHNLLANGFWASIAETFNGYYIWGIYILNELALWVNQLYYGGTFETIPKAIAIVSYAFLGFCAALPVLVLRRQLGIAYLVVLGLLLAYVPMPGSDYAIIGSLGNLKFAFVFLAFMLLLARIRLKRDQWQIVLIDIALVICAYSSVIVYSLLPIVLLQDGLRPRDWLTRNWRGYLRGNWAFWSTIGLGLILMGQVLVVVTQGIPPLPGYMDEPFNKARTIEIFGARAYLYGVLYGLYESLNDVVTVLILAGVAVAAGLKTVRANRPLFWFAAYAVLMMTGIFVANRTGVSVFFVGYKANPTDQFFYAQNMIFDVALVALVAAWLRPRLRRWWMQGLSAVVLGGLVLYSTPFAGAWGTKENIAEDVTVLPIEIKEACAKPGSTVAIEVYPMSAFLMKEPRGEVCMGEAGK